MLQPKYSVSIEFFSSFARIHFGRPVDVDVLAAIKELEKYEGIEVKAPSHLTVYWSPAYESIDVLKEVIGVLKANGFDKMNIVDGIPGRKDSELKQLESLAGNQEQH